MTQNFEKNNEISEITKISEISEISEISIEILEHITKKICIININNDDEKNGIGFFCKFTIPGNNIFLALVISKYIFNEYFVKQKYRIINIKTKDMEHHKSMDLSKRKILQSKLYPVNLIEIYEDRDGIKDFLEIDEIQKISINKYINSPIYLIYKDKKDLKLSFGNINKIFREKIFSLFPILANVLEIHHIHQ